MSTAEVVVGGVGALGALLTGAAALLNALKAWRRRE